MVKKGLHLPSIAQNHYQLLTKTVNYKVKFMYLKVASLHTRDCLLLVSFLNVVCEKKIRLSIIITVVTNA